MTIDTYTKAVLTVIAACLFVIAIQLAGPVQPLHAIAQQQEMKVDVVSIGGVQLKPRPSAPKEHMPIRVKVVD